MSRTSIRSPLRRSEWANDSMVARSLALRARQYARRVFYRVTRYYELRPRFRKMRGTTLRANLYLFAVSGELKPKT
jgi:hypothetical protein